MIGGMQLGGELRAHTAEKFRSEKMGSVNK